MKPGRCPTCDLVWNVRDDAPRVITCPRCLAALNNPYASTQPAPAPSTGAKPPPLRVMPLEHQVKRDTRVGAVGIVVVLLIVVFGVLSLLAAGVSGAKEGTFLLIGVGITVAASVAGIIFALKSKRAPTVSAVGISGNVSSTSTGAVLDYSRPMRDPRSLSPGAFFGQTIGGIIVGVIVTVLLTIAFAQVGNGEPAILGLLIGPAIGIALCFVPRLRGFGVGLIVAIPAGFLLLLGFCAVLMGSGGFR